jgi:hypothetical protein
VLLLQEKDRKALSFSIVVKPEFLSLLQLKKLVDIVLFIYRNCTNSAWLYTFPVLSEDTIQRLGSS